MVDARLVRQLVRGIPNVGEQSMPPEQARILDALESVLGSADAVVATCQPSEGEMQIIFRTSGADPNLTNKLVAQLKPIVDQMGHLSAQGFSIKIETIDNQVALQINMDELLFQITITKLFSGDF